MLRLFTRLVEASSLFRAQHSFEGINIENMIQNIRSTIGKWNINNAVSIEFENRIGQVFTSDPSLLKCIIVNLMENSIVFRNGNHFYAK